MNLAILISDQKYYRNYIESQVFENVGKSHSIFVLVDPVVTLNSKLDLGSKKIFEMKLNLRTGIQRLGFIEEVVRTHIRSSSISFQFREKRFYPAYKQFFRPSGGGDSNFLPFLTGWPGLRFAKGNYLFIRSRLRRSILYFCAFRPFFFVLIRIFRRLDFSLPDLNEFLAKQSIDLLIIPSGGREPVTVMAIASCKAAGVKSFLLLDNWDNVSSKTVFWKKPTFLGTWGPQSSSHAVSIQNFARNQVFDLGTPRFDVYLNRNEFSSPTYDTENKRYILFLGSHLFFEEIEILRRLDLILSDSNSDLFGLRVVYRPHPHRIRGFDFFSHVFENIDLDTELSSHYTAEEKSSQYVTTLEHYPKLVSGAVFVLCGLTSMIIESRILGKPVGVFVHSEHGNATSPDIVYKNYVHFDGIENLRDVILINELLRLDQVMGELLKLAEIPSAHDPVLDFFITTYPSSYGERLRDAIDQISNQV
jgi:hypothetical protein